MFDEIAAEKKVYIKRKIHNGIYITIHCYSSLSTFVI